jgi:hypothetical protein
MTGQENASERLRVEAQNLRQTALDLMEQAALLISKSAELDKQIEKNKAVQGRKK